MRVAAVLTLALSGCVVAPGPPEPYYPYPGAVILEAPPPPQVEVIGPPPSVGFIWIDGYWGWNHDHHEWVPGRWEAPRSGNHWVPHRWEREGRGWREHHGHWEND